MRMNETAIQRSKFVPGVVLGLALGLLPLFLVHSAVSKNPAAMAFRSQLSSATLPPVLELQHPRKAPTVYFITPTYARSTQQPDLVRISQSLMLSKASVYWILIEDSSTKGKWIEELLNRTGLPHTHMTVESSKRSACRGINQRNEALDWIEKKADDKDVVYFGDDDNSYDHRLFEQVSEVTGIALHPTGGFPTLGVSTPVVVKGEVVALEDFWPGGRRFPFDMASLSLNVGWWKKRGAKRFKCVGSQMETIFVESLQVKLHEIQPLANNATQILVWHTKTNDQQCKRSNLASAIKKYPESNLQALYNQMICSKNDENS